MKHEFKNGQGIRSSYLLHRWRALCLDYVLLKKYPNLSSFYKFFEETYYNKIYVIVITGLLMNMVSCHGFSKDNTPTDILTCQRNLVSYYLSKSFVILPKYY